ncbi:hypothetical protein [Novipirellula caenicola]|uniref:Uncharacterized protein n=1 Tax=Novipirellula caenicola TaxID=1536901 RepID=A0ABP9VW93_9BACT
MAKQEQDREDLLRDGRQMAIRGETTINDIVVVIGFRDAGQLSLYCGADPVFQFNAEQELRRVYFQGQRYAAESGRLVRLDRATRGGKIQFESSEVPQPHHAAILECLDHWIGNLRYLIGKKETVWRVADQQNTTFFAQLTRWTDDLPQPIQIADSPGV